jgi:hypothetical protein
MGYLESVDPSWFHICPRCVRLRVNEDHTVDHFGSECRDLLLEWGRARTGLWLVLITMPGADDAPSQDASFAKGTVLVLADVGNGRNGIAVAEDRYTFSA